MFSLANKSALIVEDFTEFARSVRAMLHDMGAKDIDLFPNAESALEACKNKKYDIVLSDYNLGPKKDGQQFLEELMVLDLLKSSSVFMMLTAENTTAMVMGAVEFQPDNYIAKPFNGNLLRARLEKAIDKKQDLLELNKAVRNKKWQDVVDVADQLIGKSTKFKMAAIRAKYQALSKLNRLDEAMDIAMEIVSIRPIPWAVQAVGEINYKKGKLERAMDIFKNMTKEYPMALEAYDWLAKIQLELGLPIEAQNTLLSAVEKSPKALERQKTLGACAEKNNDLEVMTKAYRNAVKCSANSAFATPDEYIKLTEAIGKNIQKAEGVLPDKLVKEAENTFEALKKHVSQTNECSMRTDVAQAIFNTTIQNPERAKKHLEAAKKTYQSMNDVLEAKTSLQLATSLKQLGDNDFSEKIIDNAIQENLDNLAFLNEASELTSNKELLKQSKIASQHNNKGIEHFRRKKLGQAIDAFAAALKLAPNNINIKLNYVQVLLKEVQNNTDKRKNLDLAADIISSMPQIGPADSRYSRFSELSRLTHLMKRNASLGID